MQSSHRWYSWLLKLYPARFREEFTGPMERQFADEYREAIGWQRVWLSLRAVGDLAISLPSELAHELRQDLVFSLRLYRKRALPSALALVALVVAIGATTGVFSVVNALLLRGLPFEQPERLVTIRAFTNLLTGDASLEQWARESPYLSDATQFRTVQMNLSRRDESVRANVAITSAAFFNVFGSAPQVGRTFEPGDEDRDVAVISDSLWEQFLGAHPSPLDQVVRLNGVPLTIIGVAPRGFDYPAQTAVWTTRKTFPGRGVIDGGVIARLRPGMALSDARALFHAEVARAYEPEGFRKEFAPRARLDPLRDTLAGPVKQASLVLLGVVGLVLVIACTNVAQLFLARVRERREELALRTALGASRARLVQQLVTEATLFTAVAAASGLLVAHWIARSAAMVQAPRLAMQEYTILDWRVLGFSAALAILAGVAFGVIPGLRPRVQLAGFRRARIRPATVALQVAVTVVLMAGAATLGRTFLTMLDTDLGFRTERVVTVTVSLLGTQHDANEDRFYQEALGRLRALPGVESAAAVNYLPLAPNLYFNDPILKLTGAAELPIPRALAATPDYFRTMGTTVVAGREFSPGDRREAGGVAVVNEEFARIAGLGVNVVGRTVEVRGGPKTIVGMVRTIRLRGPTSELEPQIYTPFDQDQGGPGFATFVARVRGDAESYLGAVRQAVQQIDPAIPVYDVKTLDQRLADHLARPRFYTTGILFLTGFALLVSVVGIYGVMSYSVLQRTKEIGIRIAVGASPTRMRRQLVREGVVPVGVGVCVGIAGVFASTPLLTHLLPSAEVVGTWIVGGSALVLAIVGGVALWAATGRVTQTAPLTSLRTD